MKAEPEPLVPGLSELERDAYQEIANIAMGKAADKLARLLGLFVRLPVPRVSLVDASDLHMTLQSIDDTDTVSSVCQGFAGDGISGEALIIFEDSRFEEIAALMHYEGEQNDAMRVEVLMDLSNILVGAFLRSFSEQLDVRFSQSHPTVLGHHKPIRDLLRPGTRTWQKTLGIEITYTLEEPDITCDLLMLFTQASVATMNRKLTYLMD